MVVNAWLRHRSHAQTLRMKTIRLDEFQSQLARQLVTPKAPVGHPKLSTSPNPTAVFNRKAQPKDFHLDGMHHLTEWTATRERCKGQGCFSLFCHVLQMQGFSLHQQEAELFCKSPHCIIGKQKISSLYSHIKNHLACLLWHYDFSPCPECIRYDTRTSVVLRAKGIMCDTFLRTKTKES